MTTENKNLDEKGVFFVYRHIRLDKNIPFYIGKGKVDSRKKVKTSRYYRAFSNKKSAGRNNIWLGIASRTNYEIEIIFESHSEEEVFRKEREMISLYGRIDLGTGSLANLNEGGMGGTTHTEETKTKMRENSTRGQTGDLCPISKEIFVYKVSGEFYKRYGSTLEACRELNVDNGSIRKILVGIDKTAKGFTFSRTYLGESIYPIGWKRSSPIEIYDKDMNLVKIFSNVKEAATEFNVSVSGIRRFVQRNKPQKGFTFKRSEK